ncbi:MAG: hypothetical protein ACOZNI_16845 [Myxococcota bacterium]
MTLLALLASPALAIDLRFWGVGPTIGTMAVPVNYPTGMPANAEDADGDLVTRAKGDVQLGVRAVAYPSAAGRLGAHGRLGFGTDGWNRQELVVGYDVAMIREADFQLLAGIGLGAGTERFNGVGDSNAFLRVNYFPIRGSLSGLLRDRTRAYELGVFGTYHVVGENLYFDGPNDDDPTTGAEAAKDFAGEGVAGGLFLSVGAEATVWFGDFRAKGGGNDGGKRKGKRKKG